MTDERGSRVEGDDAAVDPRYDPRFQRGYDPATDPGDSARSDPGDSARSDPGDVARSDPGDVAGSDTGNVSGSVWSALDRGARSGTTAYVEADRPPRSIGAAEARTEAAEPSDAPSFLDTSSSDPFHSDPSVPDPRRARTWIVTLAVASAGAVVLGAIGVALLSSEPPLSLTLAATSASASRLLALELISGPVLTAGLLGIAVTLALVVTGRRGAELHGDEGEEAPASTADARDAEATDADPPAAESWPAESWPAESRVADGRVADSTDADGRPGR